MQSFTDYLTLFQIKFEQSFHYVFQLISTPQVYNPFYALIAISLFFWMLEILFPWRKKQGVFRKDFWLDGFYMLFNYFIFGLLGFTAIFTLMTTVFKDLVHLLFGVDSVVLFDITQLPWWVHLLIVFVVRDFIHYNGHRMLHRIPRLWEFHKVHHSVEEMGFAAHLRFHWMETVFYKSLEYIPLVMLGYELRDYFLLQMMILVVGHFAHTNFTIPLGPLKYLLNNPYMHIWHHAKEYPGKYGVNFAITFSTWDYLFKTVHIPYNGRDIQLGFNKLEQFPKTFWSQVIHGFHTKGNNS